MTALALACFEDEGPYLRARVRLVADGRRVVGEWLPYAAESLGEGVGRAGVRAAVIWVGLAGAIALFALEVWSAVWAYPFNEGGRPLFSWPAFLVAPVEVGALAGAIGGVAMLFRNAGLTKLHHHAFDIDEMLRASQGAFVLAIACDAQDATTVLGIMAQAGATHSRLVTS
ncbi:MULTISPECIES: quinol:electron acceptor oxidoreductase subunit ActD [unclassified Sphingomonas]|uniref:quinol:electron acceptor oxidoreductase subunit ActD n=1 Tax=unclassified Sphingomonas TaxID=196159 RepID=UPI001F5ADD7E|nr:MULTISPECIES: quinol:electron acceptor oxidoreductase subunit ActD [unclassified Sphingomonas]